MAPELQLDPDQLRAHAATAAEMSEELRVAVRGAPPAVVGPVAELERLQVAVGAAVRELAELAAVLGGAAVAAGAADTRVRSALRDLDDAARGPAAP